jgi:glycerophosphoryl diester phosphodiesterase
VLEAPYSLSGVRSPQNPFLGSRTATLPRSKGFEGMAIAKDDKFLYPMLEGALVDDPDQCG